MKSLWSFISQELIEGILPEHRTFKGYYLSGLIFLGMCLSLLIACPIYASNGVSLTKPDAYAIALLIILTLGLSIYLFWVIFQPEKF